MNGGDEIERGSTGVWERQRYVQFKSNNWDLYISIEMLFIA